MLLYIEHTSLSRHQSFESISLASPAHSKDVILQQTDVSPRNCALNNGSLRSPCRLPGAMFQRHRQASMRGYTKNRVCDGMKQSTV